MLESNAPPRPLLVRTAPAGGQEHDHPSEAAEPLIYNWPPESIPLTPFPRAQIKRFRRVPPARGSLERLADIKYEDFPNAVAEVTIKVSFWGKFYIDIDRTSSLTPLTANYSPHEALLLLVRDLIELFGYSVIMEDQERTIKRTA
jgi:hypothetical protein